MELSDNLNAEDYHDNEGLPNAAGSQALTVSLIQGLSSNIHFAHSKNYRDSAEHLRYVISELEKLFMELPKIGKFNR